jgi:hypothetical protein
VLVWWVQASSRVEAMGLAVLLLWRRLQQSLLLFVFRSQPWKSGKWVMVQGVFGL